MEGWLKAGTPETATAAGAGLAGRGFSSALARSGDGRESMQILPTSAAPGRELTKLIKLPWLASAAWNRAWASAQKALASRACSRAERLAALVLKASYPASPCSPPRRTKKAFRDASDDCNSGR